MKELIREVAERTGMSEEQARSAAEAVIDYLARRLPEPAAAALLSELATERADRSDAERQRQAAIAGIAATTAALNAVVLPHAR